MPRWRQVASWLGAATLGAVLWIAAWAKALDPTSFAQQIRLEGLDFWLSASVVALLALALEFFLGTALVLGVRQRWLLVVSTVLVVFFLFLTGRTYWRVLQGQAPPAEGCGCFGNLVERTPAEAFWQDVLLLVPTLLLAWLVVTRDPMRVRLAIAGLVALGLTVFAWKSPEITALDNVATNLKPQALATEICAGSQKDGTRTCLDAIVPELREGKHVVLMADLQDEKLAERIPALNDFAWAGDVPNFWLVSSANEEALFQFRFQRGPTFQIREAPAGLLKTMYRQMPRSFLVENGKVLETWRDYPPLERWSPKE